MIAYVIQTHMFMVATIMEHNTEVILNFMLKMPEDQKLMLSLHYL